MKRVIIMMFALLLWIPQVTFASSTSRSAIELNNTRHGPFGRSLYPLPSVSYDGNTLYILSRVSFDKVTIIIEDSEGILVYKNVCDVKQEEEKILPIISLSKGYTLYITINDEMYKGTIE